MKAFIVMTIARQFMGEMVFVRSEKGFQDKVKAEEFAKSLSSVTEESILVPGVGQVRCAVERGLYTIEIE